MSANITALAPAKINLSLRVTGRRVDGYHDIDSLVAFASIGDILRIEPAPAFSFIIDGPFAAGFSVREQEAGEGSANICVRAARGFATLVTRPAALRLHLTKNLPLAAGIGGGSADAAAVVRGLCALWEIDPLRLGGFADFVLGLGADVPVCLAGAVQRVTGIGEKCAPVRLPQNIPAVLVNPRVSCPTAAVFAALGGGAYSFDQAGAAYGEVTIEMLKHEINSLTAPAVAQVPVIAAILDQLSAQTGCRFARMSGSGATCFGIFATPDAAQVAAAAIAATRPNWWVVPTLINPVIAQG